MTLHVERDGPVTTLIRNRIEARNAMDPESAEALTAALLEFDSDPDQSVAVLWGAGGAFCAGFDLKYAASTVGRKDPLGALDFPAGEGAVPRGPMGPSRLQLSKPVIAAVAGPAVAGGILPKLGASYVESSRLRGSFTGKGRFTAFVDRIPTFLIEDPFLPLRGLRRYSLETEQ